MRKSSTTVVARPMRRFVFTGFLSLTLLCFAAVTGWSQPANDNFDDAVVISGDTGNITGFNVGATKETGEPNHAVAANPGGASVWYRWTAPTNGLVSFDTLGSDFDTLLAVYTGNTLSNLNAIAGNDDYDPNFYGPSRVMFTATAGTEYKIAVDGYNFGIGPETGNIVLNWRPGGGFSAGEFRFVTDQFVASESESTALLDPTTTPNAFGAVITVTRELGFDGKVKLDYILNSFFVTNVYITNHFDTNLFITNIFDSVFVTTFTNEGFDGSILDTNVFGTNAFTTNVAGAFTYIYNIPGSNIVITVTGTRTNVFVRESVFSGAAPVSGQLVFNDYQMSASFVLNINDNPDIDPNRVYYLQITNVALDAAESLDIAPPTISPSLGTSTLTILDNETDPARPGTDADAVFNFGKAFYRTREGEGQVTFYVTRGGTNTQSATVDWRINFGPGPDDLHTFALAAGSDYTTPNSDYVSETGTLTWGQDDFNPKTITITVNNDSLPEFNEDLLLQLHNPSIGHVGFIKNANLTILFDDQPAGALDRTHNIDGSLPSSEPPGNDSPGASDTVYAVAVQPDGKTILAGEFDAFNDFPFNAFGITRMNSNGHRDQTFNSGGADGFIADMVLASDGKVVVGGGFTSIEGLQHYGVARLNSNGSLDGGFNLGGINLGGVVWSVALQTDGKILIAGDFTSYNGVSRNYVARLNSDGSLDSIFDPGVNLNGIVYSVAPQPDGKVLVGGEFTSYGITNRNRIARLNSDGSLDSGFNPGDGADGTVRVIVLQPDNKILIGGAFEHVDLRSLRSLARLNTNGTLDQLTFDPGTGADDIIYAITLQSDGKIFIGGRFTEFNQTRRVGVARLFANGNVDTSFMDVSYNQFAGVPNPFHNPEIPGNFRNSIRDIGLESGGDVIIAGSFTKVGGGFSRTDIRSRSNIARLIGGSTPGAGNIEFASASYAGDETTSGNGSYITLARNNGNLGIAAATFAVETRPTGDGAADGTDFTFNATSFGNPTWVSSWASTRMRGDGLYGPNNNSSPLQSNSDDVYVKPLLDGVVEGNEFLDLVLSQPKGTDIFFLGGENIPLGTALGRSRAAFTVIDKDNQPGVITFSQPIYTVNENGTNAVISVLRTNGFGSVSVSYATSNGSAIAGSDYTARSGFVDFTFNQTSNSFTIPITNDSFVESDETINLRLFSATGGASLGTSNAVLIIVDDNNTNSRPSLLLTNYVVSEDGGSVVLSVGRFGGSQGPLTVSYTTANGTANGSDYTATNGSLFWGNGDTSTRLITVPIVNDDTVESNETFTVSLFGSTSGSYGVITNAVVTIIEDDAFGKVSFVTSNYSVNENAGDATITLVRSGGMAQSVSVYYLATNGTATPADFTPTSGILTFAQNELSKTFNVIVRENPFQDGDRFVSLQLSPVNPPGSVGSPSTAILTIIDDETTDEPPGSIDTAFNPAGAADNYIYSTALQSDGKILLGGDFTQINGLVRNRIARLNTNGTLDVAFSGPFLGADGTVRTVLSLTNGFGQPNRILLGGSFTNVNGLSRKGVARLNLDGSLDTTFNPGSGANNPVYALATTFAGGNRKFIVGGAFSAINGIPRNGIARLNDDGSVDTNFVCTADGTVYTVAVQSNGKILIGGDFTTVNGVGRSRIARLKADGSVDPSFAPVSGANSSVRAIAVQLDGRIVIGGLFTNVNGAAMNYIARLITDGSLDAGFTPGVGANDSVYTIALQNDGRILLGGEFTQASGVTRRRITRLKSDGQVDPKINFGEGADSSVSSLAVQPDGKIILVGGFTHYDGQPRPYFARIYGGAIDGVGKVEFVSGEFQFLENVTNAVVTLRRIEGTQNDPFFGPVSINFATSNLTAEAGTDYTNVITTVSFPEGETLRTVAIPIINDALIETNETVHLALSIEGEQLVELGNQPTATLTIVSDDSAFSFTSTTFLGQENEVNGIAVTILRAGDTTGPASVNVLTGTNGTATAGVDYIATNALVDFLNGETIKTTFIQVINDTQIEGDETFDVQLQNASGGFILAPSQATVTIRDNDFGPGAIAFGAPSFSVAENGVNAVIPVIRTNGSAGAVSINYTTSNGSAIAGVDYVFKSETLSFAQGDTNKNILIPIIDDGTAQGSLTFFITLSVPTGGAILSPPFTVPVTILDNEVGLRFSVPFYAVPEGGAFNVSVIRESGGNGTNTVSYTTSPTNPTNALPGLDYIHTTNVLTFLPGETNKTFSVNAPDDSLVEGDEVFLVVLSNPTGGAQLISPSNAIVTILDNDSAFNFSSPTYSVDESGTNVIITVLRTNANTGSVSVNYTTSPGPIYPATAGVDYTTASGTLNFTNGEVSKTFTVPLQVPDDVSVEGNETVTLTLLSPSPGTQLGPVSTAILTIVDNDAGLSFSSSTYARSENGVSATITVARTNVFSGTVTVDYFTTNGTATAGSDYQSASGTLTFTNGVTNQTFTVAIIDDTLEEGNETVLLRLVNPTGNAALVNPNAATLTIVDNDGSLVIPAGSHLLSESISPTNRLIDPGETVSLLFALRNTDLQNTTNLVATLLVTNGVTAPSGPQNYGALIASGPSVSRQFTFTANGTNGGSIAATFQLQDGPVNLGRVTFNYVLGTVTNSYTNSTRIEIRDGTADGQPVAATNYPANISVSGIAGAVSKVTATLRNMNHGYPEDIDILLVSPELRNVMLMSDVGLEVNLVNVTLTFDDSATNSLPFGSATITSGVYKPTDYIADLPFPAPAPGMPYGTVLSNFNGGNPNGTWSLYVVDDLEGDVGEILNGWSLKIVSASPLNPVCDLSLTVNDSPDPVIVSNNLTYTMAITNHGPSSATGIKITNTIPAGASFISSSRPYSITTNNQVIQDIGSLAKDASMTVTLVIAPTNTGGAANIVVVGGNEADPNPDNNTSVVPTTVIPASADLAIAVAGAPNPVLVNGVLTYTITVTNNGPATAPAVILTNTLPPGVSNVVVNNPFGGTTNLSGVITCNLGTINSGLTKTITINVNAIALGTLTNFASVGSSMSDPFKANNSASVKTVVTQLQLTVTRSGSNLTLSWPVAATGYILESATNLTPPIVWSPATNPPPTIVGDQYTFTVNGSTGIKFFRLRK